ICFIVMGLSVLVAFKPLYAVAAGTCYWMIGEGICYITGAVFYSFRRRYMHSVFHFFVLGNVNGLKFPTTETQSILSK
uniref:hemolysin III family protein n=1 Tax=Bacteroides intestinalis TaxID=329854 RepID=UPI0005C8BF33